MDIRRISVIGAGVMGHGITQAFAQQGYDVSLYDLREDLLDQAITKIESNLKTFIEAGLETEHRLTDILSHIKGTTRLDRAVRGSFGFRLGVVGVLETLDLAGLDLMVKALGNLYKFLDNALEPQRVLKEKVERGDLGMKTGRGFHAHERGDGPGKGERGIRERDRKLLELIKTLQREKEGCHLDIATMKD